MENFRRRNMSMDFGMELIDMNLTIQEQDLIIDELVLKAAMYKAHFFGNHDLADKLREQINENMNARIGDFDGFCYCSTRSRAEYRNIVDMFKDNLITKEELKFCKV